MDCETRLPTFLRHHRSRIPMYESSNTRTQWPPYGTVTLPKRKTDPRCDRSVRSMIHVNIFDRPLDLCLGWPDEGHEVRDEGTA